MPDLTPSDRLALALCRAIANDLDGADTAAAMLKAVRAADMSSQPLAVGLAAALEVLIDREYELVSCEFLEAIINHLRANNHA